MFIKRSYIMASMGVFTAVMYREHLYKSIMAKAGAMFPECSEADQRKKLVPLPKPVKFSIKGYMPPLKFTITHVAAGADMNPVIVCDDKDGSKRAFEFGYMPNHTLHRVLSLLEAPETDMNTLVLNELSRGDEMKK
jgi:hypothetical protein